MLRFGSHSFATQQSARHHAPRQQSGSLVFPDTSHSRFIRLLGVGIGKVLTLSGVLGVVQGQEAFFEVFIVAIAVGASLNRSDFVVDPFQRAGRDRVVVPVEEVTVHTPAV